MKCEKETYEAHDEVPPSAIEVQNGYSQEGGGGWTRRKGGAGVGVGVGPGRGSTSVCVESWPMKVGARRGEAASRSVVFPWGRYELCFPCGQER